MGYNGQSQFGEFFLLLEKFDKEIVDEAHLRPCEHCSGKLDRANFYRKVRGNGIAVPVIRFSLCCRVDGCRKRLTTDSLRFFGRFVYGSFYVLMIGHLLNGQIGRLKNIMRRFGVSKRTLVRWQYFFEKILPMTSFWEARKGMAGGADSFAKLLELFRSLGSDWVLKFLRFLSPMRGIYLRVPVN